MEGTGQDAIARALALGVLRDAAVGDRVVVRAHHGGGAQDALGVLVARTASSVTIDTRRGPVEVALADVVAAKPVPPPPAPRPRRP
ncbi:MULTISPECIES: ferrous iron transport protein A [unclassified Curtobacterium]|uniref:ferrous iron transport protein A n=1 Tax=unclassified Curtobacterium TaxID=257496 RepID=UPI000AF27F81|nr:ferrous iron transport protein A [Curtobacterium sp. BH-2-1-1]